MSVKQVILHDAARASIVDGVNVLADAVKITLGSGGRNVILERPFGIEMGILDPTRGTRSALQNAASIASLILTTDVMIAEQQASTEQTDAMSELAM